MKRIRNIFLGIFYCINYVITMIVAFLFLAAVGWRYRRTDKVLGVVVSKKVGITTWTSSIPNALFREIDVSRGRFRKKETIN